ncbi:helix-turn-helix transcriptional regulator [Nocardia speluncae]|uniref:Helix-turn-helix transcriptional regulator n=1 Tax=Nocardia speluncae TaxID=419477 RepID=A0A846XKI3_9NOCA|nr:metalloregulator ArsR/SmtB family transcription factor [Nocardia speluncae]NKY35093.1 helix-turn-helix transcriptional regulator [Nocardia speluncae]
MSNSPVPGEGCSPSARIREPLSADASVELAVLFKALSDPVRVQLLSAIASRAGQEACVCDLSEGIELTQPTISHHLKVLRGAGLLTSERRASWVYYRAVPEVLRRLSQVLLVESGAAAEVNA